MTGLELPTVALAGYKPADQGPRGQLRGTACEPAEGVEQLPGEEGRQGLLASARFIMLQAIYRVNLFCNYQWFLNERASMKRLAGESALF